MPQVTIPAEFFRSELRVYGDWREAFARELLQNSIDANPSRIDVEFIDTPDGGQVVFADDGHGMTREVLENVYFALGKTTKTGPNSVGGFGRARLLTTMAQQRWSLRTGHLLVEGSGGDYEITDVPDFVQGCVFNIVLLDDTSSPARWAFESLIDQCDLTVPVYLNGQRRPGNSTPARASRIMKDADDNAWGKVYVAADRVGRILVRVHGLVMFSKWLYGSSDDVIVELSPARSREVLSASRDTLHTVFDDQLDKFVSDLSRNRRAALPPASAPLDMRVGGGGFLASDARVIDEPTDGPDLAEPAERTELTMTENGSGVLVGVSPANAAAYANTVTVARNEREVMFPDDYRADEPVVPALGFDVYLLADETTARVRRLVRTWDPTGWADGKGRRQRALLMTWKAAVGYAIDVLVAQRPHLGRVLWTVGFTFDESVQALHRPAGDGHVMALNPVTATGALRYSLSQRAARQELLAVALHEVAHVVADGHDETFAAILTGMFGAVDPFAADRVMRSATA